MELDPHRIAQTLGRHEEAIGTLKAQNERAEEKIDQIRSDIAEIKQMLAEARGGWRMLLAVGGLAATLSSMVTAAIAKFGGFFK